MKDYVKIIGMVVAAAFLLGLFKSQLYALQTFTQEDSEMSRVIYVVDNNLNKKLITHVNTGEKKLLALTFDDGPDPLYTGAVLNILKKYEVKATFFVVGENAAAHPDLIQAQIKAGHEIENHTYTHADLSLANEEGTEAEIQKTDQLLSSMLGRDIKYFRPPKKLFRQETIAIAERNGYQTVLWTICVENARSPTPQTMAKRVIEAARPGMIILAHDGRMDRSQTLLALPIIIKAFHKQGYQFVTLEELLQASKD